MPLQSCALRPFFFALYHPPAPLPFLSQTCPPAPLPFLSQTCLNFPMDRNMPPPHKRQKLGFKKPSVVFVDLFAEAGFPFEGYKDVDDLTEEAIFNIVGNSVTEHVNVLICRGSPCQDLSAAGVRNDGRVTDGLKGEKSVLFFHMVRIIYWFGQKMRQRFDPHRNTHRNREKERQQYFPKVDFIVENVASMSDEDKNAFSQFLRCSPIRLDAKDVSFDEDKLKGLSLQDLLGRYGYELHPDGKLTGNTFPCLLHSETSEV
ncbi:hypothetical protein TrST_g7183 [Triparma strigata]|uniref:Uncharacterized protein n=1 Tax=Triparma strigata TaxID=1606541 RepID=A0A9W7ED43_9STRA|nr:hypothetical protein TrST_g7183 [Triparma strigata]